jgi:DNA-binding transcriptional MerR regulator
VSTDTLRHYEAKRVIKPPLRQANGYRVYPAETLQRVHLVRRALAIGFSLDELADVLRERDHGGAPCRRVRAIAEGKLKDIEGRLRELVVLRDELRKILRDWDVRLAKTPTHRRAGLLENLPGITGRKPRTPFTTTAKTQHKQRTK